MIKTNTILDTIQSQIILWCGATKDAGEMALMAQYVLENNFNQISVAPDSVGVMWPWLENKNVKIWARFYLPEKKISEQQISDVTVRINTVLKQGADGAQVFVAYAALADLVTQTCMVRDDLFFDKQLAIGVDVGEVGVFDWGNFYANLQKINASAVILVLANDTGKKSDFVGRIYAMLSAWSDENKFDVHFALGANLLRIEQVQRLVKQMRPELEDRVKFIVNY